MVGEETPCGERPLLELQRFALDRFSQLLEKACPGRDVVQRPRVVRVILVRESRCSRINSVVHCIVVRVFVG